MATKGQELKKELTQAFPGLKFSVKTDKGITTRIDVIVTGLMGSPYTMSEIKLVTNKYHNYRTYGHNDSHTGNTQVHVKNERLYYLKEIKEMVPDYESNWSTVYKIADNECFTVLPDGYYEKKMSLQNPQSQEVIDSAVTKTIEKEAIDNTVVETVKEVKPKNKVAKLQAKLARLNAQLRITKGKKNQHKLIEKILKIEAAIEQLEPIQEKVEVKDITVKIPVSVSTLKKHCKVPSSESTDKEIVNGWKYSLAAQSMQKDWRLTEQISWADRHLILNIVHFVNQYQQEMDKRGLTEKYCLWIEKKEEIQDEFCKKPDKKTIELLESRFKDAQISIAETQVILKSETSELTMNCSMELPELDYRRKDVIKSLIKQNQNPKIHSVYEYIGSILLAA